jgi:hypothetical protein
MPATIQHESGNTFCVRVTGTLRVREMADVQAVAAREIQARGKLKLLFVLDQFEGFEQAAGWDDLDFYATYGRSIEKIAIVGDDVWQDHALMFAGAGLRAAPVRYFAVDARGDALAWLSQ